MFSISLSDPADLKRLSSLLQWFAIGLVFLGGVLQLLRFVVDQREKGLSVALTQTKETAQLEREGALRLELQQSRAEVAVLATRDTFRPLSPELRQSAVDYFRQLAAQPSGAALKFRISIENGSRNRVLVRDEMLSILHESGIDALETGVHTTFGGGPLPLLNFRLSNESLGIGNELIRGLAILMKTDFPARRVDGLPLEVIEMTLFGEPQFNPDGSFSLK